MVPAAGPALLAIVGGTLALLLGLLLLVLPLVATELSRPRDSVWGAVVLLLGLVLVTSADRLTGAPMLAVLCGGLLIGRLSSEVGLGRWRQLTDDERRLLASSERWSRSVQQLGAASTSLLERAGGLLSGLATKVASRPPRPGSSKRWVRPELPPTMPGEAQPPTESDSGSLEPGAGGQQEPAPERASASGEDENGPASPAAAAPPSQPSAAAPDTDGASDTASGSDSTAALWPESSGPSSSGAPAEQRTRVVSGFEEIAALLAAAPAEEGEPSEAG